MLKHVEHIGIAVRDLQAANALYTRLLGVEPYKQEQVAGEGVNTSFFQTGQSKIELLEAINEESPISKHIEKRGEGIHHIAFEVEDILHEMARLKAEGFRLLNDVPKPGADRKLICFVHPKDCHSVLIELCQSIPE